MIWCPYTNNDINESDANLEHIIPLALGGSNQFTILVDEKANSTIGSDIDAAISNNFLTLLKRQAKGCMGHSKTLPKAVLKKSYLGEDERPVQATFGNPLIPLLWDPITKKSIPDSEISGMSIRSEMKFGFYDDLRFIAKVSLASGYYIFGDIFRNYAAHDDIRMLLDMNSYRLDSMPKCSIRAITRFSKHKKEDEIQKAIEIESCSSVDGACVLVTITHTELVFTVGLFSDWIGTLIVPAETEQFPYNDEKYDLGHVIKIENRNLVRMSYRSFLETVLIALEKKRQA